MPVVLCQCMRSARRKCAVYDVVYSTIVVPLCDVSPTFCTKCRLSCVARVCDMANLNLPFPFSIFFIPPGPDLNVKTPGQSSVVAAHDTLEYH